MRIAILAWGTRGDVQPMLALGQQLAVQGHKIRFGAAHAFADTVRAQGFEFVPLGPQMDFDDYQQLMATVEAEKNPRKQNRLLVQNVLLPNLERYYADCLRASADVELIVGHWLQIGAGLSAETLGIPWVSVTLHPAGIESEQTWQMTAEGERSGAAFDQWLWGDRLQRFRAQLGLRSFTSAAASLYSDTLNLVSVSRYLLSEHTEWNERHQVTGYFFLDEPQEWQPDAALLDFLERHDKPIIVSFSSLAGAAVEQMSKLLLETLKQINRPAIIQSGWGGFGATPLPSQILRIGDVPHEWLFKHAACVVHHGGAGTTAAALRCGVPSVVIWHMFDQPYWGNLLAAKGLGPLPLSRISLSTITLAKCIEEVFSNPSYSECCRNMSEQISQEDGVRDAVQKIQALLDNTGLRGRDSAMVLQHSI